MWSEDLRLFVSSMTVSTETSAVFQQRDEIVRHRRERSRNVGRARGQDLAAREPERAAASELANGDGFEPHRDRFAFVGRVVQRQAEERRPNAAEWRRDPV